MSRPPRRLSDDAPVPKSASRCTPPSETVKMPVRAETQKVELPPDSGSGRRHTYHMITEDDDRIGLYREGERMVRLCNFVARITRDRKILDEGDIERTFGGQVITAQGTSDWKISASDYANDSALRAELFRAAGVKLQIDAPMSEIRCAISEISQPLTESFTTHFGYTPDRTSYATQSGVITKDGFSEHPLATPKASLDSVKIARNLNLTPGAPERLQCLQAHIAEEFCRLASPEITCLLLSYAILPILWPHSQQSGRFSLWIVGQTGAGKTFLGRLLQNFYGNFPLVSEQILSWTSTANYLQAIGFYFGDALAVIDDFKGETCKRSDVIRLIQNYADGGSRGRLNADATTNTSRPFRGWLLATGECVPEQTPSALSRMIVVHLPNVPKNMAAGQRCVDLAGEYSAITADIVHTVLKNNWHTQFAVRLPQYQQRFYQDIAGQQNDMRIASNLALLQGAFDVVSTYFASSRHALPLDINGMTESLMRLRTQMVYAVHEESTVQVFLQCLSSLLHAQKVHFIEVAPNGRTCPSTAGPQSQFIGRRAKSRTGTGEVAQINSEAAISAVNCSLKAQGRPELHLSPKALLRQLVEAGMLLNPQTHLSLNAARAPSPTIQTHIEGQNLRLFCIAMSALA